jgi:hypothetical protein
MMFGLWVTMSVFVPAAGTVPASGLHCAEEPAGIDLPERHRGRLECLTGGPGVPASLVVELALLGDIVQVQRIRVRLIRVRGAVAHDDHVASRLQRVHDVLDRRRALSPCRRDQQSHEHSDGPNDGLHPEPSTVDRPRTV